MSNLSLLHTATALVLVACGGATAVEPPPVSLHAPEQPPPVAEEPEDWSSLLWGEALESLAWSPRGEWIAGGDVQGFVWLWSLETGQGRVLSEPMGERVYEVAFSQDGRQLRSAGDYYGPAGSYSLFDVESGAELDPPRPFPPPRHTQVWAAAWHPSWSSIAAGGREGHLTVQGLDGSDLRRSSEHHGQAIRLVAWSGDGSTLATRSEGGEIWLWDADSLTRQTEITTVSGQMTALAFSPDSESLVAAFEDGTVQIWTTSSGRATRSVPHPARVGSVAFDPGGESLATACDDGMVRLFGVADEEPQVELPHPAPVQALAWSPDGATLATACDDGRVRLWDAQAGETRRVLESAEPTPPRDDQ